MLVKVAQQSAWVKTWLQTEGVDAAVTDAARETVCAAVDAMYTVVCVDAGVTSFNAGVDGGDDGDSAVVTFAVYAQSALRACGATSPAAATALCMRLKLVERLHLHNLGHVPFFKGTDWWEHVAEAAVSAPWPPGRGASSPKLAFELLSRPIIQRWCCAPVLHMLGVYIKAGDRVSGKDVVNVLLELTVKLPGILSALAADDCCGKGCIFAYVCNLLHLVCTNKECRAFYECMMRTAPLLPQDIVKCISKCEEQYADTASCLVGILHRFAVLEREQEEQDEAHRGGKRGSKHGGGGERTSIIRAPKRALRATVETFLRLQRVLVEMYIDAAGKDIEADKGDTSEDDKPEKAAATTPTTPGIPTLQKSQLHIAFCGWLALIVELCGLAAEKALKKKSAAFNAAFDAWAVPPKPSKAVLSEEHSRALLIVCAELLLSYSDTAHLAPCLMSSMNSVLVFDSLRLSDILPSPLYFQLLKRCLSFTAYPPGAGTRNFRYRTLRAAQLLRTIRTPPIPPTPTVTLTPSTVSVAAGSYTFVENGDFVTFNVPAGVLRALKLVA